MTNNEKKRVLNSYRRIVQQERAIREEIDSLTLLHSPSLDGMPHGASDPRGLDAFWVKAGALFEKWQALLDKKYAALSVITDEIELAEKVQAELDARTEYEVLRDKLADFWK